MSGAGLTAMPSSAQTVASIRSADAEGGQRAFGRFAVVGRGHGDPAAAVAQPVEESMEVGQRSRECDRIGGVPGRLERPFRIALADAARQQHLASPVAQAGHRRGGQPAAGDDGSRSPGSNPSIA